VERCLACEAVVSKVAGGGPKVFLCSPGLKSWDIAT
jgi:hypothetical protein